MVLVTCVARSERYPSSRLNETNVVADYCRGADRDRFWVGNIELHKLNLVLPHLAQEVFEDLDGELLARAAAIAESKWSEAGIVAHGHRLPTRNPIDGAKPAIVHRDFPPVFDLEFLPIEWAFREPDLLGLRLVDLVARRHGVVA